MTIGEAQMSHLAQMNANKPMESWTCYGSDFVKHPNSARQTKVLGMQKSHIKPMDNTFEQYSTYATHFQKYDDVDRSGASATAAAVRKSVISEDTLGKTFQAETGYTTDYGRPKGWVSGRPERVVQHDNDSTLTDAVRARPFNGESTYRGHFVFNKHEKSVSARPLGLAMTQEPFAGNSEYRRQYTARESSGRRTIPNVTL